MEEKTAHRVNVLHASGCAVRSVAFEGEIVFGTRRVEVLNGHATLDTAQGESSRLVGLLVVKYTDTPVLK